MKITRREWLRTAGAGAASLAYGCSSTETVEEAAPSELIQRQEKP